MPKTRTKPREKLPALASEALAEVLTSVAKGTPRKYAAQAAGIHETTFYRYCRVAKTAAPDTPAGQFWKQLKTAEGQAVKAHCDVIRTAADKTWQAAAWWLERLYPEDFGANRNELAELKRQLLELKQLLDARNRR